MMLLSTALLLGCVESEETQDILLPVPNLMIEPSVPKTTDNVQVQIAPINVDDVEYPVEWSIVWTSDHKVVEDRMLSSIHTRSGELWTVEVWYTYNDQESTHIDYTFEIVESSSAIDLAISPRYPKSSEDVEASIVVLDPDFHLLDVEYRWAINGTPQDIRSRYLPADRIRKDDEVILTIQSLNGDLLTQSPILEFVVDNTKPILEGAAINPPDPNGYDVLSVSEDYFDHDEDVPIFEYRWFLNGRRLDNVTTPTLSLEHFVRDDVFTVEVRGSDGEEYTDWVMSQPVTLRNTPPIISNLMVSNQTPRSNEMLSCNYESYTDFDLDTDQTSMYWIRNGQQLGVGQFLNLDAVNALPKQVVYCVATAKDGIDNGNTLYQRVVVKNTAPVVYQVALTPDPATVTQTLACQPLTVLDIDGTSQFQYEYEWYVNGINLNFKNHSSHPPAVLTSTELVSDPDDTSNYIPAFEKGDTVVCSVSAHDGIDEGAFTYSNGVHIINTPPVATGLSLDPPVPTMEDIVECVIDDFHDPDVDDENQSNYVWYKNGQYVQSGSQISFFEQQATLNDVFTCEVQLFDGEDFGAFYSISTQAVNQPPSIVSLELTPELPSSQDSVQVTAVSSDPDGDLVTLQYQWYVNTQLQTETSNTLSGPFVPGDIITVDVTPFDSIVTGLTMSSVEVEIQNTTPEDPVVELILDGSGLQCALNNTPFDLDGDPITSTVEWRCDAQNLSDHSNAAQIESSLMTIEMPLDFVPSSQLNQCLLWQCSVTHSDGVGSSNVVFSNLVIP